MATTNSQPTHTSIHDYMLASSDVAYKSFKSNMVFHQQFFPDEVQSSRDFEIFNYIHEALQVLPQNHPSYVILSNLKHILQKEGLGF